MAEYEHYKPKGYPAWFIADSDETTQEWERIRTLKEKAMKDSGQWPSAEFLASLDEEERWKTLGNARSVIDDFVEMTYYRPIGNWLHLNAGQFHMVLSEQNGWRVVIDFVHETDRSRFLAAYPNWTIEKPACWWDLPGVQTVKERYGRNEDYDVAGGKRMKDDV
jgi:hypothetical protein